MSKVTLKVEIDEKEYKALIGQEVFDIWRGNTLLKTIFKAIKTATPITESDDAVSRQAVIVEIRNLYPDIPFVDFNNARLKWTRKYKPYLDCEEVVKSMPSVLPKQKDCTVCKHSDEVNGEHCYECVKNIKDNFEPYDDCMSKEAFKFDEWDIEDKKAELWVVKGRLQIRHRGTIHNVDFPVLPKSESEGKK